MSLLCLLLLAGDVHCHPGPVSFIPFTSSVPSSFRPVSGFMINHMDFLHPLGFTISRTPAFDHTVGARLFSDNNRVPRNYGCPKRPFGQYNVNVNPLAASNPSSYLHPWYSNTGSFPLHPGIPATNLIQLVPVTASNSDNNMHVHERPLSVHSSRSRVLRSIETRAMKGKRSLLFMVQNLCSLGNKTATVHTMISDSSPDVLILTETWVKPSDPLYDTMWNEALPNGYRFFNEARAGTKRGGGVGIVFSDRVISSSVPVRVDVNVTSFEFLAVRAFPSSVNSFIVVSIYRPPSNSISAFINDLDVLLVSLRAVCDSIIICGDVNLHLELASSPSVQAFRSLLSDFNLHNIVPSCPTHSRGHTLDFVAISDSSVKCSIVNRAISDHHTLSFHLPFDRSNRPDDNSRSSARNIVRSFRSVDPEAFVNDLDKKLRTIKPPSMDVDSLCEHFNTQLTTVLDDHAPLRPSKSKKNKEITWTSGLSQAKRLCRRSERRLVKSGLNIDLQVLRYHRSKYALLLREAKAEFYNERITSNLNSQRELFKVVSELTAPSASQSYPECQDGTLADTFADFFTRKVGNIIAKLPAAEDASMFSLPSDAERFSDFELCDFQTVSEEKVMKARAIKTSVLDLIPRDLFRTAFPVVLPHLTQLINTSLVTGKVPRFYKQARISPLLKKATDDPIALSSYRPVSNLSYTSKILESIVAEQLTTYIHDHRLFNPVQSAYRRHHSTETALLHVHSNVQMELDRGLSVFLVLLDLSAAFDTINHEMLLRTLNSRYHISGKVLQWVSDYLTGRSFRVGVAGSVSTSRALGVGVPQGSVLGPILFNLYTAPLNDIFTRHRVKAQFYADDTQFWCSYDHTSPGSETAARSQINQVFIEVRDWMMTNHLMINPSKTVFLPISRRADLSIISPLDLDGISIPTTTSTKNLGFIFDNTLSFKEQISNVRRVSFFHLRRLRHIRSFVPRDKFESLVHAFITNKLDLCNSLYYNLPSYLLTRLQNVQSATAKCLLSRKKSESATEALDDLHWLPIRKRIQFKVAVLAFKIFNGQAPQYFIDTIIARKPLRATRLAQLSHLCCPTFTRPRLKSCGDRAFYASSVVVWNGLPESLREIPTLSAFKRGLKSYLYAKPE